MSYLGLDIGTTGCKAVIFSASGDELARAYREYPLIRTDDGGALLDPMHVIRMCLAVIREAAGLSSDPVQALAVSSQGEAIVPVDDRNTPLMHALVSSDQRPHGHIQSVTASLSADDLYQRTGHTPHPMFTLFKLAWLRDTHPEVWDRAAHFYCFEELLHAHLGITPVISHPLAARTMLFNIAAGDWDDTILATINLSPSRLARTAPSGTAVGIIPDAAADDLRLARGCIIVTGGHDQPCGALGAGVMSCGEAAYTIGTVECITPVFDRAVLSESLRRSNLATYPYTIPGKFTTVAFSLTGGNSLAWIRDEFGSDYRSEATRTNADVYDVMLSSLPDAPTNILTLPYFTPSGTPHFDIDTPACIYGLRLSTTKSEIVKSIIEGVSYEMKDNITRLADNDLPITSLLLTGGGSKNRRLAQIKADVLGIPIERMPVSEGAARGAATLAASAHTLASIRSVAEAWRIPGEMIEPDSVRTRTYAERFRTYRSLYRAMREFTVSQH